MAAHVGEQWPKDANIGSVLQSWYLECPMAEVYGMAMSLAMSFHLFRCIGILPTMMPADGTICPVV